MKGGPTSPDLIFRVVDRDSAATNSPSEVVVVSAAHASSCIATVVQYDPQQKTRCDLSRSPLAPAVQTQVQPRCARRTPPLSYTPCHCYTRQPQLTIAAVLWLPTRRTGQSIACTVPSADGQRRYAVPQTATTGNCSVPLIIFGASAKSCSGIAVRQPS